MAQKPYSGAVLQLQRDGKSLKPHGLYFVCTLNFSPESRGVFILEPITSVLPQSLGLAQARKVKFFPRFVPIWFQFWTSGSYLFPRGLSVKLTLLG